VLPPRRSIAPLASAGSAFACWTGHCRVSFACQSSIWFSMNFVTRSCSCWTQSPISFRGEPGAEIMTHRGVEQVSQLVLVAAVQDQIAHVVADECLKLGEFQF
jgi:hypothetical protein